MQAAVTQRQSGDVHLWMIAAGLSLLVNLGLLMFAGLSVLEFRKTAPIAQNDPATAPPEEETSATIYLDAPASSAAALPSPPSLERRFARTSPDQAAPASENPAFIGERNTRATSDRPPVADAPQLPSQAGITPRDENHIETTESDYKDGSLTAEAPVAPESEISESPSSTSPAANSAATLSTAQASRPPPREALLKGPNPVDVQVRKETAAGEEIKATPEPRPAEDARPVEESPPAKAAPVRDPAFSGFQRKTAVVGSISRTGRSSLDVEDTALGRYQVAISRAVELEWQRNCVRHRDYITPGFLTVRFFVETSGRVRSVQFVGDMETGEIQKGFTLNSIRDADIPAMPAALRREYDKEPLELVFRFYF
jgi:hypothetical protein